MSTLGGSRGERHAKPKFTALDINSLYRTSRGESLEPSTQKNTVPRKHGMQSLGKVPSARRPPANLPSLKAETSSPGEQQGTWGGSEASSGAGGVSGQVSGSSVGSAVPPSQPTSNQLQQPQVGQPGGNLVQQHQHTSSGGGQNQQSSGGATTWSSVATGGQEATPNQPPHYQSPQFQHEFPSLDGSTPSGGKGSHQMAHPSMMHQQIQGAPPANVPDGGMSLRPQTDAASWMQQQQQGGGNGGGGAGQPNSQQGQGLHQVPPQFRALMPPFMYRSGGGGGGGGPAGAFAQPPLNPARPRSQPGAQSHYDAPPPQPAYQGPPPGRRGPPPRRQDDRQSSLPYIEPEVALLQRPIIKEEELERMEAIAKDEGWAKHDEIDYNAKLNFSDDEACDGETQNHGRRQQKMEEDNRAVWNREKERERAECERVERERNERNVGERQEREGGGGRPQQNGHRGLDAETVERVQRRMEEEERRAFERKQAAAKKLQELEQKMMKKNSAEKEMLEVGGGGGDGDERRQGVMISSEVSNFRAMTQIGDGRAFMSREKERLRSERDDKVRDFGRYDKYERDMNSREREYKDGGSGYRSGGDQREMFFSKQFRSNLPPRFQNAVTPPGGQAGPAGPASRSTATNYESSTGKAVPFAQQYDIRYINSQNYGGKSATPRRNAPPEEMRRRRGDSEDDDRFSSGRESIGRNSIGTPQLARSISDSSQRKTSVSSEEPQRVERSESREFAQPVTSWADELEMAEGKKMADNKTDDVCESQEEIQPKQILQRVPKSITPEMPKEELEKEKRMSESPKQWSAEGEEKPGKEKQPQLENIAEKKDEDEGKKEEKKEATPPMEEGKSQQGKRPSPRGGRGHDDRDRRDIQGRDRNYGSANMYRGSGGNWNRRGGRIGGSGRQYGGEYWAPSDGDDEEAGDEDYGRRGGGRGRKDGGGRNSGGSMRKDEAFTPRGEPSRRGRGGGQAPSFRRGVGGTGAPKRIDGYGPPSSKSPFGTSDEKSSASESKAPAGKGMTADDRTKLNQMALSAALTGKPSQKSPQPQRSSSGTMKPPGKPNDDNYESASDLSDPQYEKRKQVAKGGVVKTEKKDLRGGGGGVKKDNLSSKSSESQPSDEGKKPGGGSSLKKDETGPPGLQRSSSGLSASSRGSVKYKEGGEKDRGMGPKGMQKPREVPGQKVPSSSPVTSAANSATSAQATGRRDESKMSQAERERQSSLRQKQQLPPRLAAKQRERLQRPGEVNGGGGGGAGQGTGNAWEKPLQQEVKEEPGEGEKPPVQGGLTQQQQQPSGGQKGDPNKAMLDGSTPPVNTIIFENTNYKQVPQMPIKRQGGGGTVNEGGAKKDESVVFKGPPPTQQQQVDMLDQARVQQSQTESISSALSSMNFTSKSESEYEKDMKLAFTFESEISQLTDDKSSTNAKSLSSSLSLPRSIHNVATQQSNSTISPSTADLNMKIASVKKVWDPAPFLAPVLEQPSADDGGSLSFVTSSHQQHLHQYTHGNLAHVQHTLSPGPTYSNTFGPDPTALEHFGKSQDGGVEQDSGYSPSPQHVGGQHGQHQGGNMSLKHAAESLGNSGNVCKVKPTQQQMHQSGLGLSPPPLQPSALQAAPQTYYQPSQFGGMSAIPSPPAVLFNSSAMPSYGPFQMEAANRSQYSQYPGHYGTGNAPYSAYMQTAPPNMPTAPAPDMYQSLTSQFRMGGAVQTPFNQSQQLNNPSTVLISSSTNSLMSASVKPSSQQIGAIGSKTGAVNQPPYQQQYMGMYPPQQGPPMQSNSYYSNSAGGQGAAYFGAPSAGATQNYGVQAAAAAGMFGSHGAPAPSSAPPPPQQQVASFGSQFLNSPLLAAAAMNQQYRQGPTQMTAYMNSKQQSHMQDPSGRQLKSPLSSDGGLGMKHPPPQSSPITWEMQHQQNPGSTRGNTGNLSRSGGGQQQRDGQAPQGPGQGQGQSGSGGNGPSQRYPTPIQRPTNYPNQSQAGPQSRSAGGNLRQPPTSGPPGGNPNNKHFYGGGNTGGGGTGGGGSGGSGGGTRGNHGASGQDQSNVVKQMEGGVNVSQDGGGVHKDDKD